MGSTEKFCLRWNDFETNISAAFRELREDKDFFDVTIACDDDQLQAHKVILSACSPFFRTILRRNKHEHPLLYLKGVKYADLVSVLNFMYHGEVNVAQEELNSFLAVAEDLKVKGLTQNNSETSKFNPSEVSTHHKPHLGNNLVSEKTKPIPKTLHTTPISKRVTQTIYQEEDDIQEVVAVKSEPTPVQAEAPTQYTAMVEQPFSTTTQQNNAGIMANPTMEYEEEEYADYGGYGGYEGMEGGYSEVGGQEGFKGNFKKSTCYSVHLEFSFNTWT